MPAARRSEAAECDLQDIAFHIAFVERRPVSADRIIDERIAQAEKLAELSVTATLRPAPEIGEGVRLFPYSCWVLLFDTNRTALTFALRRWQSGLLVLEVEVVPNRSHHIRAL